MLGNSGSSVETSFQVDLDLPVSTFVTALPRYTNCAAITLSVNADDATSPATAFVSHNSLQGPWLPAPSPGLADLAMSVSGDGAHWFVVMAVDAAGNAQPSPFGVVNTTLDTVPPRVVIDSVGPSYTNVASLPVCTTVVDVSPTVTQVTVTHLGDGVAVNAPPQTASGCVTATLTAQGNHTVAAATVDAATNPSTTALTWVVYDTVAPAHSRQRLSVAGCVTVGGVVSCNSPWSALFRVLCQVVDDSATVTAPCRVQWLVQSFSTTASSCSGVASGTVLAWQELPPPSTDGLLNVSSLVASVVHNQPTSRCVLLTRAIDDAGKCVHVHNPCMPCVTRV